MIYVVNKRGRSPQPNDYYIGRPSPLGNPYYIGKDGNRREVIGKYRIWLKARRNQPKVIKALDEIKAIEARFGAVNLVCWCSPLPCHGDVVREFADAWREWGI